MDSADPQGSPGVNHEDGITGPILTRGRTETALDSWTAAAAGLREVQKDVPSASRLLFLTVEYVEEHAAEYGRSAFAGFEPGTPFSPQPPTSLSEFEHRVSPLDPNLGTSARYSPVFTISGNSDVLSVTREISSNSTPVSSTPNSPFPSQVVVLTNPSSPLMNTPSNTLPSSPSFTETSHGHSPLSNGVVTSAEITEGFVNHILANPVDPPITCSSSSVDGGDQLLRQVVADDNYFHQQSSSTPGGGLTNGLGVSPLSPNSPHSPLQAPLTPADNYVVSSSTETLDAMGPSQSNFHSDVTISVANSPGHVDSTSEMMIQSSMQQTNEIVGASDSSPFHDLETAGVMSTTHDVQLKHDPLDRVQLLISSSNGSIAYSLNDQNNFMQTQIVDMDNELLTNQTSDDQHLNSVINSFKTEGLVISGNERGDIQLRPSQTEEIHSGEKLAGALGLQEFTLAVRQQQSELLQQTLLAAPLNGDLTDSVAHLSDSLLNDDVKISIVDPSLEAVESYTDILMDSACIGNSIGNDISENNLVQESPEIFTPENARASKHEMKDSTMNSNNIENCDMSKTLGNSSDCESFSDCCCSLHIQSVGHKSVLDCILSSLPSAYLCVSKLPLNKAKEPGYGVFARKAIPKRTQFGPVEGILLDQSEFVEKIEHTTPGRHLVFLVETETGRVQKLDVSHESSSNWMRFIRVAYSFKEQNLVLNQQGQSLFFTTTKVIQPRQELRVWYSLPYARKHGLPCLQPLKFDTQGSTDAETTWSCFECNKNFANPMYLQCHLNIHELSKIKEVNDGKSAEKENYNLNHESNLVLHSMRLKSSHMKSESCVDDYHACNAELQRQCTLKGHNDSQGKSRKYLCEVCGYQFSRVHRRDGHHRQRLKDTNMNDSVKQLPAFPRKKLQKLYSECRRNKNKTEWFCDHCNLTFDNPSIRNLHTLVHAAENLEETEIITEMSNDFSSVPKKSIDRDLHCPKCTKKVETSDITFGEHISKVIQPSHSSNVQHSSISDESTLIGSNDAANAYNLTESTNFMEARIVDMNTDGFFAHNSSDDHQLTSVLNSFKIEGDKLSGALDLQDISLAVQQPQNDLLEQTLLATSLNGDLTDSVVCFGHYDDVKISIVDPSLETVGAYTDILLENACIGNTPINETVESGLSQKTPDICPDFDSSDTRKLESTYHAEKDDSLENNENHNSISANNLENNVNGNLCENVYCHQFCHDIDKMVLAHASTSLPARYLTVKKLSCKTGAQTAYGVFARKIIRKRTVFGPIEGILKDSSEISKIQNKPRNHLLFLVDSGIGKVQNLDISKKTSCNWMRFIRVAVSCKEQNVTLSQKGQSLFLTTTKVIHPKQELRVWYSLLYAKKHGLPLLEPLKLKRQGLNDSAKMWLCFECNECFRSSLDLQYHLNIHELDRTREENTGMCIQKDHGAFCSRNALYVQRKTHLCSAKCKDCRYQTSSCYVVHHKIFHKRQRPLHRRKKKFLCEYCGFEFPNSYNRDRHIGRVHKEANMNGMSEQSPPNPERSLQKHYSSRRKTKNKSEWFCNHCKLTFDNPSVQNLHTLVHAAENLEETEVISDSPNDVSNIPEKSIDGDLRCPKCTKRVVSSDENSFLHDVPVVTQSSQPKSTPSSSMSEESILINSNDTSISYTLNEQTSFMESRVMDTSEFLTHGPDDDHHLNCVFNTLKMQDLVIGESENGDLQLPASQMNEIQTNEKLSGSLGLGEFALSVRQQQNDLLQQTLLTGPLNGDLSESVAHLSESLLNDDVKISIVDPSLEVVAAYTDILMESACTGSAIENEISESSFSQETSEVCSNMDHQNTEILKIERKTTENDVDSEIKNRKALKTLDNENNCIDDDSSEHSIPSNGDSFIAIASASLPISCLTIRKLPQRIWKSHEPVYGVFARKTVPKRTQFGPIDGFLKNEKLSDNLGRILLQHRNKDLVLSIEMDSGVLQKLDIMPGSSSCWMQCIRTAPSFKEQNLILNQQGQSLYFTTTKVIHPKQELRVWYSLPYANKRNLPLLQPDVFAKKNDDKVWPCFECSEKFPSSEGLQIHLNIHDFEREDEDSSDKRKLRKHRSFRRKGVHHFSSRKYNSSSDKQSETARPLVKKEILVAPGHLRSVRKTMARNICLSKQGFPYQCHTCNRAFPRNYNLKRHQLLHAKEKKYLCEICGCQFTHMYNRDRHIRKRHKDINVNGNAKSLSSFLKKKLALKSNSQNRSIDDTEWYCMLCNLVFDSVPLLNLHTLSHGGEFMLDSESLLCPQCSEEFLTKKELIDHVADHGKLVVHEKRSLNPAKPWKCELCYKSFATEDRLQRHMLVHGAEESKPLQCDICYKRFLNNSALACHIKIHTAEKKMFECPICKVIFDQVLLLKEHVHSHSENGVYTCPQCNKVFDGYSLIRKHIRAFHSDRKHTCNYCGKLFPKLDKLRMHMLRHSDHREFLCANCGKQFKRKDKLKEHMKRMHSAERELRLALKPHRPPAAKKFMPKVSPTDYHRFIYKCHTCLLGFKRRGMLVNHLAKRHPDISPESVPELNLPILKTTRDYYCQYCEKVYKSSSKRKAHILKIHPGAELPMSNRRKGGVPEIPGLPNPTFSQTVGSFTTHPHGCPWCHKQYASKAKLLQHQRKKHIDLLPQSQQLTSADEQEPPLPSVEQLILPEQQSSEDQSESTLTQLQGIENVINIIPGDYHISTAEDLHEFQESGIIIDTSTMERPLKVLPDGISADLLSQAMSELTNEFRVSVSSSPNDHYLRIVQTSPGHITVTQSPNSPENPDKDVLSSSTTTIVGETDTLSPTTVSNETSSHLHQLLSESYSLSSSPSPASPQTWSNTHVTYTPYTAR